MESIMTTNVYALLKERAPSRRDAGPANALVTLLEGPGRLESKTPLVRTVAEITARHGGIIGLPNGDLCGTPFDGEGRVLKVTLRDPAQTELFTRALASVPAIAEVVVGSPRFATPALA
jgi:hypothetical protein